MPLTCASHNLPTAAPSNLPLRMGLTLTFNDNIFCDTAFRGALGGWASREIFSKSLEIVSDPVTGGRMLGWCGCIGEIC